jgi:hypothetical protein
MLPPAAAMGAAAAAFQDVWRNVKERPMFMLAVPVLTFLVLCSLSVAGVVLGANKYETDQRNAADAAALDWVSFAAVRETPTYVHNNRGYPTGVSAAAELIAYLIELGLKNLQVYVLQQHTSLCGGLGTDPLHAASTSICHVVLPSLQRWLSMRCSALCAACMLNTLTKWSEARRAQAQLKSSSSMCFSSSSSKCTLKAFRQHHLLQPARLYNVYA